MENKSYNLRALRGDETYDDKMFQQDMKDDGINIPDDLLFKPELNQYVADEYRKYNTKMLQTVDNPISGMKYTEEEAKAQAEENYQATLKRIKKFS